MNGVILRPRSNIVYWVEDDAYAIDPLVEPLRSRGYQIEVVCTMQEALDRYEELSQGCLVIVDLLIGHSDPS